MIIFSAILAWSPIEGNREVLSYPEENECVKKNHCHMPMPDYPISSFPIEHLGYFISYDARHKNPGWVYEHLDARSLKKNVDRSHCRYKEEESLPKHLRASLADYYKEGFDRGHMAAAANHCENKDAMSDTFFMSNMCPQAPGFNRGYSAKLEKHVRGLTKYFRDVYVISGPLYLPTIEENGKRFTKYQVIGPNDVAVPTHFFKVIFFEDKEGTPEVEAYILPNEKIAEQTPLEDFATTIQKVEKSAGILFDAPENK